MRTVAELEQDLTMSLQRQRELEDTLSQVRKAGADQTQRMTALESVTIRWMQASIRWQDKGFDLDEFEAILDAAAAALGQEYDGASGPKGG